MIRSTSTRALARLAFSPAPVARRFAHGEPYHRNHLKGQTANGINAAALALAGLFGWTGVVFYMAKRKEVIPPAPPVSAISSSTPSDLLTSASPSEPSQEPTSQAAAFNPETGEINWDCPCLGGMADGPCGPQFKEAFACFVYSEAEPKGVECVAKFRNMQDCFRKHPDIYGNDDEDEDDEDLVSAAQAALAKPDDEFASSA